MKWELQTKWNLLKWTLQQYVKLPFHPHLLLSHAYLHYPFPCILYMPNI